MWSVPLRCFINILRDKPPFDPSPWETSHCDTQLTTPTVCTKLQTTFCYHWNLKKDGSKKSEKCGNTGSAGQVKALFAQRGGGGVSTFYVDQSSAMLFFLSYPKAR